MSWITSLRTRATGLAHGTDGSMTVGWVLILPGLILSAGVAIDISVLSYEKRVTQGQADLAALSAIRNLSLAPITRVIANKTAQNSEPFDILRLSPDDVVFGRLDETNTFVANDDQMSLRNTSAVMVRTSTNALFPVLRSFLGENDVTVRRRAIAKAEPQVSFALSNCLLSFNLFNEMLRPMVHLDGDVLCSGHGLRIHAFELMDTLAFEAHALKPGEATYGDVLDAELAVSDVIGAALGRHVRPVTDTMRLSDILYVGEDIRSLAIGSPVEDIELNVADVVFGSAEILGARIVDLDMTADLGPFANVPLRITVSEPRQVVIGATPGDPDAVARTSQIRIEIEELDVLGVATASLAVRVANAEAHLSQDGEHCNTLRVSRAAVFDPARASLVELELETQILGGVLNDALSLDLSLAATTKRVTFSHFDVARNWKKQFSPSVGILVDDLGRELDDELLDVPLVGGVVSGLLGAVRTPVVAPVGAVLEAVAEDLLGLGLAEAQLEVLGVTCQTRLAG